MSHSLRFSHTAYLVLLLTILPHSQSIEAQETFSVKNAAHGKVQKNQLARNSQPLVIGYSGCAPSIDFWNKLSQSIRKQASQLDIVLVDFSSEDFSLLRQKNNIAQAIEIEVDGMILGAVSDGLEESVELLKQHKIPVVTVGVPIIHDWISTHVGTSSKKAAALAGNFIRENATKKNPSGGRVVIVSGDKDQENSRIRGNTPTDILQSAGYNVSVHFSEDWSGVNALKIMLEEFSTDPEDISAVFSTFEPASIAMVEAAERFKLTALLVGFDWSDTMRQMIVSGRLHAAVVQNPTIIGKEGLLAMVSTLQSKNQPKLVDVPPVLITIDNVESY